MVELKGLHKVEAKGRVYYYAWRGGPRIKSAPGSQAFVDELASAQASRVAGDRTIVSGLCAAYRASEDWKDLSEKTRSDWSRWLDRIQVRFGKMPIRALDAAAVRVPIKKWRNKYRETPRAADMGLQVFSRLCSFAVDEGMIQQNPIKGIKRLYSSDRSEIIWTPDDLKGLAQHASKEVMDAARLASLTGLRKTDLLRLSWSHVKANSIEIRTGKSSQKKTTLIPIYSELRALLDELWATKKSTTVLVNTEGNSWRSGFGASWQTAFNKADLGDLHFHDLRGTAATRFYLAGLSIREIAHILTWSEDKVERLIDAYVKKDELLLARIRKLDRTKPRTKAVKPAVKLVHSAEPPKP